MGKEKEEFEEEEEYFIIPLGDGKEDEGEEGEDEDLIISIMPPEQVHAEMDAELEDEDARAVRLNPYNPRP